MFEPTIGGFRDGRFNGTMQNVVGPTLVAIATEFGQIWAILHKNGYKSACMPDRPDMFGPTRGNDQGGDLCCHGNDICAGRGVYNRLPACCL